MLKPARLRLDRFTHSAHDSVAIGVGSVCYHRSQSVHSTIICRGARSLPGQRTALCSVVVGRGGTGSSITGTVRQILKTVEAQTLQDEAGIDSQLNRQGRFREGQTRPMQDAAAALSSRHARRNAGNTDAPSTPVYSVLPSGRPWRGCACRCPSSSLPATRK